MKEDIIWVSAQLYMLLFILRLKFDSDQQWWFGRITRGYQTMEGLFPSNYVTITDSVRQQFNIQSPTA